MLKNLSIFLLFSMFLINIHCFEEFSDFNPCNVDDSTCMPLEDFDQNCTCILLSDDKFFNVTDDVYLFMTGYPIHMSYITQTEIAKLFRKKLSIRIPKFQYYDASEPDTNLYQQMKIEEKMTLFVVSTEKNTEIMKYLIYNQFLRTEAITKSDNRWCMEGECNAFVYESSTINRTIGVYSHAADLLQIIEYRGRSIFAVSSVYGEFSVPKIQRLQCEHKCKIFYWNEREMCKKQCKLRLEFDLVSMTSDLKRNFDFFVQSSAIQNFRMKYRKFL
ncbi:Insulin/EGF-Receptor L Domain protein [Caenorhabditis elegans]|uniref:Insulin/EGF-Receptor L Domain protein n=1 Tax=Caenorhabditis elegans TaxID=6239 RepID=Q95XK6_CAEEL|nr:Insulin/EGF-Receptor L Domain protein [Caenorhabditis elegans]CCD73845.1 Insulin/EGF-Receptor L Domain protein [Caenorhabditis elegans]|eukprot:NP_497537.2 Uncharacterized protein CELE_Y54F10BM.12 [Caenorhabditis elegans]